MTDHPIVRLRPKISATRFRHGHPWAYDNELVLDRRTKKVAPGTIVELQDSERVPLATAALNTTSRIAVRILDVPGVAIDQDWFEAKFRAALALRERLYSAPYYRLIHAEGDGMPGVVVDRFGDHLVIQPNAAWAEVHFDAMAAAAVKVTGASVVVKNATGRARGLEGLDTETQVVRGSVTAPVPVLMNGATYMADLLGGQKTGLFFDQRDNHAFAARLAKGGRMVDVFSHVGGFSLAALAGGATQALAIDGSAPALALAEEGSRQSGVADKFSTQKADAFAAMQGLGEKGEAFDLVVCDPPAFAPAKSALSAGLRAYEKVARMGARLVAPGGYLVLCSCSQAASVANFRENSLRGIGKSGRKAQIIATGGAGADHPVHPMLAETSYLKSLFLRLN
ncbi:MAG: class I SAM-dependent rRNA methyltransferase [Pseudomonadota bacterium]